jgi:hypothetical protein
MQPDEVIAAETSSATTRARAILDIIHVLSQSHRNVRPPFGNNPDRSIRRPVHQGFSAGGTVGGVLVMGRSSEGARIASLLGAGALEDGGVIIRVDEDALWAGGPV